MQSTPKSLRRSIIDELDWRRFIRPIAIATVCVLYFAFGFLAGDKYGSRAKSVDNGKFSSISASTGPSVIDLLRSLPPVDVVHEYGIVPSALKLYPEPLGEKMCILNVDTRKWQPSEVTLDRAEPNQWGYINHYLYAKMHGYTYKYIRAHEEDGYAPTWVKVKEQFRMTMKEECKFVLVMDADTIISDLRVPLETLLGHWNVTENIAITGGRDIDSERADDDKGRTWFNSGFVITQNTPDFVTMMRDWIACPTDVKYKGCSKWKHKWSNEQAAFSNYIRYDPAYKNIIREVPVEEVHLGGFVMHYWSKKKKVFLRQAAHESITNRFFPDIYTTLIGDWNQVYERTNKQTYAKLMEETRPR